MSGLKILPKAKFLKKKKPDLEYSQDLAVSFLTGFSSVFDGFFFSYVQIKSRFPGGWGAHLVFLRRPFRSATQSAHNSAKWPGGRGSDHQASRNRNGQIAARVRSTRDGCRRFGTRPLARCTGRPAGGGDDDTA